MTKNRRIFAELVAIVVLVIPMGFMLYYLAGYIARGSFKHPLTMESINLVILPVVLAIGYGIFRYINYIEKDLKKALAKKKIVSLNDWRCKRDLINERVKSIRHKLVAIICVLGITLWLAISALFYEENVIFAAKAPSTFYFMIHMLFILSVFGLITVVLTRFVYEDLWKEILSDGKIELKRQL